MTPAAWTIGVFIMPGRIEFARMPDRAYWSSARLYRPRPIRLGRGPSAADQSGLIEQAANGGVSGLRPVCLQARFRAVSVFMLAAQFLHACTDCLEIVRSAGLGHVSSSFSLLSFGLA